MMQPWRVNLDEQAKRLSCTTDVIADLAVTEPKLADHIVTTIKLSDGSITPVKIKNPNTFHFTGITLGDGTASTPSLAFLSAPSTGLFLNGSNVALAVAGVEKVRIGASSTFLTNVSLANNQLTDFRVQNVPVDPPAGNAGRLIWRTDSNVLKIDTGTGWITFGGGTWGLISGSITNQTDLMALLAGKEPVQVKGSISESTSSVLTILNGLSSTVGPNVSIEVKKADATHDGYLSATDWNIFNAKQDALGFTPEDVSNKSTSISLGTSNTLYPTQLAVKTYVDNAISGFSTSLGGLSDVQLGPLADGQVLKYNISTNKWINAAASANINFAREFLKVVDTMDHDIVLSHTPIQDSETVSLNGMVLVPDIFGHSTDYTISGNVLTLSASISLTVDDQILVAYAY